MSNKIPKNTKKYVITSVVLGAPVSEALLKSLRAFCKIKDAKLLVVPIRNGKHSDITEVDFLKGNEALVTKELSLSKHLKISTINVSPTQIDPNTGITRLAGACSIIYGSPRFRLAVKPVRNGAHPRMLAGCGALSLPRYDSGTSGVSQRRAYLANRDHCMGALFVEVMANGLFHLRHLEADKSAKFIDLGVVYTPKGVGGKTSAPSVVLGDWHTGETDKTAKKAWFSLINELKVKEVLLHDLFDGHSISPHERECLVTRSNRFSKGHGSLKKELEAVASELKDFLKAGVTPVVVESNHDIFLTRYLESNVWIKDAANFEVAVKIIPQLLDGNSPLQTGVELFLTKEEAKKIKWLRAGDSYKVSGIQCAYHGHRGPNGSRGDLGKLEETHGRGVFGHSHTPGILRGAYQVGTSSIKNPKYHVGGGSSWMHTSCVIYPNGTRQLINSIFGRWKD